MNILKEGITAILKYLYQFTHSYGWSIILLTILIRVILYPLTASQLKSMATLRKLQPKLKELEAKFKGNPQEYQRQILNLYREYRFNPFGGCLPLLIQFPILIALFYALRDFQFGEEGFLWIKSLSRPDPTYLLPILAGLTQYVIQELTPSDPSQKSMMAFMPIFMGVITIGFPAGLAVYWVANNILQILQQLFTNKVMAAQEALEETGPKKGREGKEARRK